MSGSIQIRTVRARAIPHFDRARATLRSRIAKSIAATRSLDVVYEDVLGEGTGAWHSRERYPTDKVNCVIWVYLVLAEAYGQFGGQRLKQLIMDCLRYYGGVVGFSMRKHYLEQWLAFDPGPLIPISLHDLHPARAFSSVIEPQVFLGRRGFDTLLYNMELNHFSVEYSDAKGISSAAQWLPPGYYIFFAVPTNRFREMFAERCGLLGLIHGVILELDDAPNFDFPRPPDRCIVHHSSVIQRAIVSLPLDEYIGRSTSIHEGYVLCDLNPYWKPEVRYPNEQAERLLHRERQLGANGFQTFFESF